jgi:hypothetical protein
MAALGALDWEDPRQLDKKVKITQSSKKATKM